MATSWTTTPDLTYADMDEWKAKIISADSTTDFKTVSEAPENLTLNPEDFEIVPEEIQADSDDWVTMDLTSPNAPGWTTVEDGTS